MKKVKRKDVDTLRDNGEPGDMLECSALEAHEKSVPLPPEAHGRIGQQLREIYGRLLAEPLPDELIQLLEDLAKAESKK